MMVISYGFTVFVAFMMVCGGIDSLDCKKSVGTRVVSLITWVISSALMLFIMAKM